MLPTAVMFLTIYGQKDNLSFYDILLLQLQNRPQCLTDVSKPLGHFEDMKPPELVYKAGSSDLSSPLLLTIPVAYF